MSQGVVIWPKEQIDSLLSKADAKRQQDNTRLARLQQETRQERRG
jgi:4-hydroxy-4-methyl-2-oxoglutarate aldolase